MIQSFWSVRPSSANRANTMITSLSELIPIWSDLEESPADILQCRGKILSYKTSSFFCNLKVFLYFLSWVLSNHSASASTMASSRLCTPLTRAIPRNSISRPAQIAFRLPRARTARFYSSKKESKDQFIIWRPWLRLSIGIPFIGALIYSMVWPFNTDHR